MKLALKLVLLFLACLLLIVAVFSYLTLQQQQRLAIAEQERMATDLANVIATSLPRGSSTPDSEALEWAAAEWSQQITWLRIRIVDINRPGDSRRTPSVPSELLVARKETVTIQGPDSGGEPMMYTYVPLSEGGGETDKRLEVAMGERESVKRLRASLAGSLVALLATTVLSAAVIVLGGVVMVGRPLDALMEKMRRVGEGDLSDPLQINRNDELGKLGVALNEMCAHLTKQRERIREETASRIAAVQQLRHAERLNTVGRLAAGLAHEIGTPLNVVSGRAELIAAGKLTDEDVRDSALAIKAESQRITKIVRELLDFARRSVPQRETHRLDELISETLGLLEPLAKRSSVEIDFTQHDDGPIAEVDAGQIQQVLTNLVMNGVQASSAGSSICVRLDKVELPIEQVLRSHPDLTDLPGGGGDMKLYRIQVTDSGKGIAEEDLEHIFEPFFTTKDVGEGTGLGLSIAYGIIQEHGGWIDVESVVGQGTTFCVYLPR